MNPAFHLGLSRDTRPWRPDVVTAWRSGSTEPATLATRAWGAVPIVLALAVYRRAVTTGFAQDDFHWLIAATTFDSTPAYAPRFLSMHLAFRAIVHLCGTNALAFHVVALVLLAASAWLIYAVLAANRLPGAPWIRGGAYGAVVFLGAQLILMPLVGSGIFSSGDPGRLLGSLAGHLVYGGVVGWYYGRSAAA